MSRMPLSPLPAQAYPHGEGANLPAPACRGLSPDERFVVGAVRRVVSDGLQAPEPEVAFVDRCGRAGLTAVQLLRAWLSTLAENARRQIAVGYVSRCCPSPDEVIILAIIEGSRRGDFAGAHALLGELVYAKAIDQLAHAAEQLGEALNTAGISLRPVRFKDRQ